MNMRMKTKSEMAQQPQLVGTTSSWRRWLQMVAATVMTAVALLVPQQAWADLETTIIEGKTFYVLRSSSDWDEFRQKVENARGNAEVNAIMAADFSISNPAGPDSDYPFMGIFDGNGHTLNANISVSDYGGVFGFVKNATIRNLHVTGSIESNDNASGLAGYSKGSTIAISNCRVSAMIKSAKDAGGLINGVWGTRSTITNCLFDGKLIGTSLGAAFVATVSWSTPVVMTNCLEKGTYEGFTGVGLCCDTSIPFPPNQGSNNWAYRTGLAQDVGSMMNSELVMKLGSDNWVESNNQVVPKGSMPLTDVEFETYDIVPGTNKGEEGMLKIPFSCTKAVTWVSGTYTDENGNTKTIAGTALPKNTFAGFIMIPATEQHKNLKLNATLVNGLTVLGHEVKDDKTMHYPRNLTAEVLRFHTHGVLTDAGAVELKWEVKDPDYDDVVEGDQFLVMRSLTGQDADLQTIGTMMLESNQANYTYKDSTLTSALTTELLHGSGDLTVKYMVVRGSAQQLWGLSNNAAVATASCPLNMLHLLRIKDYTAQWADTIARTVSVKWQYANENGAVWDDRAQLKMLVSATNRDGAAIDSTTYVLTADEMTALAKTIQLSRSCVNYKIELMVDTAQSPLSRERQGYMAIRTADDWTAFCEKVEAAKGASRVNASLEADITVSKVAGHTADEAYCGVFEGNGHTLNVNIDDNAQNTSLFSHVKDATILDLHVTGNVISGGKFASGLAACVDANGSLIVENCRVSTTVTSRVNGDATNGGFLGIVRGGSNITIRNCVFDGSFEGANCHSNGGFIGWIDTGTTATIENCLFSPTAINTKVDNCATWTRGTASTVTNCHATKLYSFASGEHDGVFYISSAADWSTFVNKVKAAGGNSDVNAILNADITVSEIVGKQDGQYYRGTFDGNGHTINANISSDENLSALFHGTISNTTIRNLKVTGSIKGRNEIGAIVGFIPSGAYDRHLTIENCHVSAHITTTHRYAGGFLGLNGTNWVTINNCLFDGTIDNTSNEYYRYGAAFISISAGTNIANCLENGNYINCTNTGAYFNTYSQAAGGTNCWTYKTSGWSEMNHVGGKTAEELVAALGSNNWHVVNNKVVPVMTTIQYSGFGNVAGKTADEIIALLGDKWTKDSDGNVVPLMDFNKQADVVTEPELPSFYYENLGHIDRQSLQVQTLPTSALLTWANETDEPVDYYEVWRKDKSASNAEENGGWKLLKSQITEMQYEDKQTSPVHQYIYKVRGVTSCEGDHYDETEEVDGMCYQTASVEGHLRFLDGTGIPGKKVVTTVNKQEVSSTTDESGYFRLSNLPYVNSSETSYQLSVVGIMNQEPLTVSFGTAPGDNVVKNRVIEVKNSVKLSGNVTYEGTSIPVQGVSFKVDGYEVHSASGRVTTNHEGKFAFRILPGDHDSIQAVKDGHVFSRNGFYHQEDNDSDTQKAYNITIDNAEVKFYDQTRVKLIGRIVGGKTEGEKPLGNALSKNNLGDDLQMVFTLEGDNASRLVFDINDRNKTTRDEVFLHEQANNNDKKYEYKTKVHTTINRMVVTPDPYTGEYEVLLPPVKWKIQQITAKGYPTLFQDGQVGDVLDLTDSITLHIDTLKGAWETVGYGQKKDKVVEKYHAKYSRIYHSPVLIEYKQQGFANFDFFGDQYYSFKNISGDKEKLTLAYGTRKQNWPKGKRDSLDTKYTFGYPVFSIDKKYPLWISASEKYYYNNNVKSDTVDVVSLPGGLVTIHNGMVDALHRDTVRLDSLGQGTYVMDIAQKPYLLTGKDALQTMTMTLLMDGTHYEAEPLKGYVLQVKRATGAKDILSYSTPQLLDVLRDPPGGKSKATLSKGSTLKYTYTMDMKWSAGLSINLGIGTGLNTFTGVVAAPMGVGGVGGFDNGTENHVNTSIDLVWSGSGQRAFTYTMTAKEDISTSADPMLIGADGDLYIGVNQNIVVSPATAIRAIPDSVFRLIGGQLASGRTVEIAQGLDNNNKLLHLVRDEVVTYGPVLNSTFIHSQHYIMKQLLPELTEQIRSLMFTGTESEAQAQANATNKPVYLSLVDKDNEDFGTKYKMILPPEADPATVDEVARYQQTMVKWVEMIAQNEREKLSVGSSDLVKNFDVDGASALNYSETFQSDYSLTNSFVSPITAGTAGYFDNSAGDGLAGAAAIVGPVVAKLLGSILKGSAGKKDKGAEGMSVNIECVGFVFKFGLVPAVSFGVTPKDTKTKSYSRTESFAISMDRRSHLNFDVYRVKSMVDNLESSNELDVFYNNNFNNLTDYNIDHMKAGIDVRNFSYPRSFVYRTRGGATCRPWEGERKTLFHQESTILDERTKKIENPVIKMDRQSLSGVPFGEPARFKLYLTNESEQPEIAHPFFNLYQNEKANPDGAKMMIDGMPLTGNMRTIEVHPGQVTEKTLEVYAGEKFDYEGLKIGLISLDDVNTYQEVAFDVHYLHTAGNITITTPGDKWIMNCDAPFEEGKGWYLPVVIGGFDKNQHNFDHIEFQYKETTRGDDYWTNLCGYYADSTLYRAASGTKAMIPENGNIVTRFFGEGQVMEKGYDLRAVLFCRNGNAFLTSESKVLSGVKDTRRPQLFGSPEPKSGILWAGDNIIFDFSEDIEYNYLQATTNFDVVGETNETAIQEAPSLQFTGNGYARSQANRNFSNKNVTIEMMIKPDESDTAMPIFSHGTEGRHLQLWLRADKYLSVVIENGDKPYIFQSDKPLKGTGFQRVALVLDKERKQVMLYGDSLIGRWDSVSYNGYGPLVFGYAYTINSGQDFYYKGRMLQARLWYRALDLATLNRYGNKLLTGYELGLADYYPMNDGRGNEAKDLSQGAHLMLHGASWAQPEGMSLKIDANETRKAGQFKGLRLRHDLFQRDDEQDYTLMFWFKTAQENGTLLANGSGHADEEGAASKFFIGFEGHTLLYRTNGREFALGDILCDNNWHHYAMTVNRSRNVATIYIDNEAKAQFATDSLGGMVGTRFYLGNMVWQKKGQPEVLQDNALTGHIDGLALFEQALPTTLIKRYATKSPGGEERGLLVYMDFARQEQQQVGGLALQPNALSQVVKRDNNGNDTGKRDSVFVNPVSDILAHIDPTIGAPVQAYEKLRKLNFSFVGRDNQLMVNIDEQDTRINKRNVYVTLNSIPDKNGNFMGSPVTESFYVNRNPLNWYLFGKKRKLTIQAGQDFNVNATILNEGGKAHTYTIENLPNWLTVDKMSDVVDPQSDDEITFTISKNLEPGFYDQIIYLTDEEDMTDPMYLELTVEGQKPEWAVAQDMKRYSMNIVAQVYVGNTLVTDARDMVGVFDEDGRCMGVSAVKNEASSNRSLLFMTVYNDTTETTRLFFRLWHAATGKTMLLSSSQTIDFGDQAIVGTVNDPVHLRADDMYMQKIALANGWNWVSFNVYNAKFENLSKVLSGFNWQEGDMLTEDTEGLTLVYKGKKWISSTGANVKDIALSQRHCYRVMVQNTHEIDIWGRAYESLKDRTVTVAKGWNSIGYTPLVNLPVTTALTDYFDEATPGDVVKNQHEFAMFVADGKGSGEWMGNLEYMKPGEGYMFYRQKKDTVSFAYPFYEPGTAFIDYSRAPKRAVHFATTMTVVAEATGIALEEGDRLVAYAGGEQVGEATAAPLLSPLGGKTQSGTSSTQSGTSSPSQSGTSSPLGGTVGGSLFYLSIAGDVEAPLSFAIIRDGETIATTGEMMTYEANGISGSPAQPTQISFVKTDKLPQQGWYTLDGIKLPTAPKRSGVYLYNGKKQVIQ